MKTILLGFFSLLVLVASLQTPNIKTITATYMGYEEGVYSFYDDDDNTYEFQKVEAEVLKSFNLKSEELLEKKFKITYKVQKEESDDEEAIEIWTISKLELVKE